MNKTNIGKMAAIIPAILLIISCQKQTTSTVKQTDNATRVDMLNRKPSANQATGSWRVYAEGLNNPRGLKFGPDGNLYVAEGGLGGDQSTAGECDQVVSPVGPYTGSPTGGRISMITSDHVRHTVSDKFPSSQANEIFGGDIEGVADIEWVNGQLYALLAGAGCSHGVSHSSNGIARVDDDGNWSLIADLSEYQQSHPVAHPEEDDFEPDGTWYSMINVRGDLYAVEPNHGELVKVTLAGDISRVVDISASQGHIVPTAIAYHGNFFVGNLHPFPIPGGASKVLKITPDGTPKDWATGLNTVLGLVIDKRDRMYVLEMTVPDDDPNTPDFPTPGQGRVIRIDPGGNRTIIADGLSLPTGMTMGPDGKLYVSNWGFGPPAKGGGQVLQIDVN
ncbi:MAG: ScyD/ScyE family protein [Sphingobacteriales bacterium]